MAVVLIFGSAFTVYRAYDVVEEGVVYTYTPRGSDTYPVDTPKQNEQLYDRDAFIERVQTELTAADRPKVEEVREPVQIPPPVYGVLTPVFHSTTTENIHETQNTDAPQIADTATTTVPEIHNTSTEATSSVPINQD